jgi:hypothetical protein
MKKVDFLIIGAQKAGTSALDDLLRQHPEIGMASRKELHFFDKDEFFFFNNESYETYEKRFNRGDNKKIYGESTPIYMYWDTSCKRIWQYNKKIKLIAILRNPIERAYSHWNMEYSKKKDPLPFYEAVLKENIRIKEKLPLQHRVYSYIDRGFYSEQIRRLLRFFDRNQILFIKYESLVDNPDLLMKDVFKFLDVSSTEFELKNNFINRGKYDSKLSSKEFKYLRRIFKNDIREVENLLGWNCSDWLIQKNRFYKYEKYFNNWWSRIYRFARS